MTNRHVRRALAKQVGKEKSPQIPGGLSQMAEALSGLQEFAQLAEQLKPHLEQLQVLAAEVEQASATLQQVSDQNLALRNELALQREVFVRMFARLHGLNREEVLSMETLIQEQLAEELAHADTSSGTQRSDSSEESPSPEPA